MTTDVLVVDEADDALSHAFAHAAARGGTVARRLRLDDAARTFNLRVGGEAATVQPAVPILLRPLRPAPWGADSDDRFLWGEQFATLWAAAALTDAPVVNRPGVHGLASTVVLSAVVTDRQWGAEASPAEAFWHRLPPAATSGWFHQDLSTWRVVQDTHGVTLGRSRALPAVRGWDQVVVVGDDASRVTTADIGDADLEHESIQVAKALDLAFMTVTWAIPADGAAPLVTRVNAFPSYHECVPVLGFVCTRLLRYLAP